ncbi:TetR/AcrR family transcriptional regulator [uncultured Sphingomonas sp.]|uniref:TetR/AcrR family transcriptional regulator n=1 Tax=uncultured Sphingomonas sp. TaxID=158754 RepID=UPI0035CABADA
MVWLDKCCGERSSRAGLRRRKLIETARMLFIQNGFHATGIAQIARESGIAVGQIYRDFSAKEEIVAALVEEDCGRFMDVGTLDAAIAGGDSNAVRAWLRHFVDPDEDRDGDRLFAEIMAEASRNERVAAIFVGLQDRFRANLLAALTILAPGEEAAAGHATLADTIMTLSIGLLHHRLIRPTLDMPTLAGALRSLIDREVDALRPQAAAFGPGT